MRLKRFKSLSPPLNFAEFLDDDKTRSAVVRKLEIIGEAAKNIPNSIKLKYKDVPWREMAKMRDKISHDYFGVDYEIVWNVLKEKLPPLRPLIQKIIKETD